MTTAVSQHDLSGAASAQSVLERVLTSINVDNSNMLPVTGTFANIAENIAVLGPTAVTEWTSGDTTLTQAEYDALVAADEAAATAAAAAATPSASFQDWDIDGPNGASWSADSGATTYPTEAEALAAARQAVYDTYMETAASGSYTSAIVNVPDSQILNAINGSITNTMSGITTATASVAGSVLAYDQVQVDIGDLSTTVLGAVNTGDITLGVNQDVSEAISGTSSAVSASINQLGGMTDQTALVLNVASNATDVIGSVSNSFTSLNGSIGNVATTVLGAVNTGTITSGINAAVNGVQSGIVGN